MTMMVATHEMRFAKTVADTMVFMGASEIVEKAAPGKFFTAPDNSRTQFFSSQILTH